MPIPSDWSEAEQTNGLSYFGAIGAAVREGVPYSEMWSRVRELTGAEEGERLPGLTSRVVSYAYRTWGQAIRTSEAFAQMSTDGVVMGNMVAESPWQRPESILGMSTHVYATVRGTALEGEGAGLETWRTVKIDRRLLGGEFTKGDLLAEIEHADEGFNVGSRVQVSSTDQVFLSNGPL